MPLPLQLDRLFVFPLPEAHLFPGALLPLHVFEPRYRALTRDCLATSKRMAVALLEPGYEADYEGRPPIRRVCGVGEILQSRHHPDGRYDVVLRGLGRARIVEELPPHQPYRLVRAVRLDDAPPGASLSVGHKSLLALCDRLATVLPSGGDTLRALARQEPDPAAASDVIAAALVTESDERQLLLESLDPAARLDRLAAIVAALVGRFQTLPGHGPSTN